MNTAPVGVFWNVMLEQLLANPATRSRAQALTNAYVHRSGARYEPDLFDELAERLFDLYANSPRIRRN